MCQPLNLTPGWTASIADPPQFDDVAACMKKTTYSGPVSLEIVVYFDDERNERVEVSLFVVPTSVRLVLTDESEDSEYTFEGWVVRPVYGDMTPVWVRCDLQKSAYHDRVSEGGLTVLEPGTEQGVAPPPGFN